MLDLIRHPMRMFLLCVMVLSPLFPFLWGYFPAIGDMRDVFIPMETFFHEQQLQGNIPAWNPAVSFGFPVIAAAQIGFFYPVLFILRFLPIYLELPIALMLHISAAAIGTFLFARRLKLSHEASFLTALCFALSQFVWQHITHLNIFLAIAWFPWQMLVVHTVCTKKRISRKNIITLSLLFGIPFLIGQIQIPFLMMVVGLLYGIFISPLHIRMSTRRSIVVSFCVATFALLLASVQLFPTFELANLSSRGSSNGFDIVRANQHSYPLYHLPTLLFPRFYGNDDTYWGKRLEIEYGSYIGVMPLMLVIWYVYSSFPRKRESTWMPDQVRHDSSFFISLLIVSFLLSLGSLSPFRLIGIEPSLWVFSAPARWLLFATFAASILAGFGFDALWNNIKNAKGFFRNIAIVIVTGVIIGNIILYFAPKIIEHTTSNKLPSILASAKTSSVSFASPYIYITLISLVTLPYALSHKHGKKIILTITAIDLILIAATTTPVVSWKHILMPPETISNLPQSILSHNARVYSLRDNGDTGAYFTNPESRANAHLREIQRNLLLPMAGSQFGIYGVEWPASLDLTSQAKTRENLPQGAEDLAIGVILSADDAGNVHSQELHAKPRVELIDGNTTILSETPRNLKITTTSISNSALIIRDTFYPGWHAFVDGKEVAIQKQEPFFRSVLIPAGEHIVIMEYIPKIIYSGGVITLIILLICAIIIAL